MENMAATSEAAKIPEAAEMAAEGAPQPAFSKTTHSSVRRADARLPRSRPRSTPVRPQYARFPFPTPRNWPRRNQGPPSRRYEGAANATNDSVIDGDGQGDPNPSTNWRHAWPSASCSASKLTTRGEPSASATSPLAKSSCVRPSYGTPQPTPERQFPETRRLGGGATRALLLRPKKTSHYTCSMGSRATVSEEPESEQHEPGGGGGREMRLRC